MLEVGCVPAGSSKGWIGRDELREFIQTRSEFDHSN